MSPKKSWDLDSWMWGLVPTRGNDGAGLHPHRRDHALCGRSEAGTGEAMVWGKQTLWSIRLSLSDLRFSVLAPLLFSLHLPEKRQVEHVKGQKRTTAVSDSALAQFDPQKTDKLPSTDSRGHGPTMASLKLQVVGLDGTSFGLRVMDDMSCGDLLKLICRRLPQKPGAVPLLCNCQGNQLEMSKCLKDALVKEDGADCTTVSYVYKSIVLESQWPQYILRQFVVMNLLSSRNDSGRQFWSRNSHPNRARTWDIILITLSCTFLDLLPIDWGGMLGTPWPILWRTNRRWREQQNCSTTKAAQVPWNGWPCHRAFEISRLEIALTSRLITWNFQVV